MSESIEQQLIELSQFKTLISQILAETGNTAPDTGFRQWYEAIKIAILSSAMGLVILTNAEAKQIPNNKLMWKLKKLNLGNYMQYWLDSLNNNKLNIFKTSLW